MINTERIPSCFLPSLVPWPESLSASCKLPLEILSRGSKTEENSRGHCNEQCPGQRGSIDTHAAQQRQRDRSLVGEIGGDGKGNSQAQHGARERKHQALRQQLPHQPATPSAQSRAHGKFLAARSPSRQQQIRKIHAHDQQNQAHRAPQHNQRPPQFSAHVVLQPQ